MIDTVNRFRKQTAGVNKISFASCIEISSIIKELKSNKATSHDNINAKVFKNLPRKVIVFLIKLINGMHYTSHFLLKNCQINPSAQKNKDASMIGNH